MKKYLALFLCLCMMAALCAPMALAEEPAGAYKLGLGVSLSTESSKAGNAQVDATTAAVVLDAEGRIVAVKIDVAQNKMDVTDGEVDTEKTFLTKSERGEDYAMREYSPIGKEWFEQAEAFELFVTGKTVEEIEALETVALENGHVVAVDEELLAGCTISIGEFKEALLKACKDEQGMRFDAEGEFKLGLAINTTAAESKAATEEEDGVVKMYSEYAAVVVDENGGILAALTDATQPQIAIDEEGEIGEIKFAGTKRELKEDYNMVAYSEATLEWYEQAWNFVNFAVGKTAEELRATETVENGSHTVFADEELHASCSISIAGMIEVIAKAAPAGEADGDLMVTITFLVVHGDGSQKEFVINTEGFTLREALEQENLIEGTEGQWGLYVLTVDGETVDEAQQQWWCLTKNGEMSMTGVDDTIISDGDHYEFTFTIGW
ncbi:MAG: DUF4430 domain-containing protein [Oscillospiraceae bacterium]|nr:DUF4430 domain-containing protein [Oscillospiraceae bacterium]